MTVSRQKIYDAISAAQKKYKTFDEIAVFVSYIPIQGVKLVFVAKKYRGSMMKEMLDVTYCFRKKSRFEIADEVAYQTELWLKEKLKDYS